MSSVSISTRIAGAMFRLQACKPGRPGGVDRARSLPPDIVWLNPPRQYPNFDGRMFFSRCILFCVLFGFLLTLGGHSALADPLPVETVLDIHFLGAKQIAADTNSATLRRIWRLPETQALVAQTLDKLSRLPVSGATNAIARRLRPLLDDFIASECFMKLDAVASARRSTQEPRVSLAVRLPADRDRLWRTNLAKALSDIEGTSPRWTADGWVLQLTNAPYAIAYSRIGGWTFMAFGGLPNSLETNFINEVLDDHKTGGTKDWLEADLRPSRLAALFPQINGSFAKVNLDLSTMAGLRLAESGENGLVHTAATLDFSHPLNLTLPPWAIPTNVIHGPLTGFTAYRGISAWLAGLPAWQRFQFAPSPNQAFIWSVSGAPYLTCIAVPIAGASNQLSKLSGRLVQSANAWLLTNNADGLFKCDTTPPGITSIFPIISPLLKPAVSESQEYLLGGLFPLPISGGELLPTNMLSVINDTPDLVYYDEEDTSSRMREVSFLSQLFHIIFNLQPWPDQSVAIGCLNALTSLMGKSVTVATTTDRQISLTRSSTMGLDACEIYLLADWLESPQFPRGVQLCGAIQQIVF